MKHLLSLSAAILIVLPTSGARAIADLSDDFAAVQTSAEEGLLDSLGGRFDAQSAGMIRMAADAFGKNLASPAARAIWSQTGPGAGTAPSSPSLADTETDTDTATFCGTLQARLQHAIALEMLAQQRAGNVVGAQEWRALITLPKHASAVEGALALQRLGATKRNSTALTQLLAKEYVSWQTTRIREKLDSLRRTADAGRANAALIAARLAEVRALADFPKEILEPVRVQVSEAPPFADLVERARAEQWAAFRPAYASWRSQLESSLPNLLSAEEVARRERLLLKLIALIPKEYHAAGVRENGEIMVPLEYRHTQSFLIQAEQLVNELSASWRTQRAEAYAQHLGGLREQLDTAGQLVSRKAPGAEVAAAIKAANKTLEDRFGLSLARAGSSVDEIALEVHTALSNSLAAAHAGKWRAAEDARLDAYTTFDLTIEKKVMPRDPNLAIRAENSFLDGGHGAIGIKAALDARLRGAELEKAYGRAFEKLAECQALLKVAVSPATIIFSTMSVVMREGLEAVVILAAILAGLRGPGQEHQRKGLIRGAWVAIAATALTFWLSRTLIKSLSVYGENLEAVISLLAVCVLLIVTNWVFHKIYWVQWNAKLRHLSKAVENAKSTRVEWLGLIGVGFLTIYREGFETSLFLQSLILEGGIRPVGIGLAIGLLFIATIGVAVFKIGARLPYRKMLVVTGVLVVLIMITFIGSTVRLFQTVGWLPIHPITWLDIPSWMGIWFGIYPSWEGILIPPLGLGYVGGAWLYMKLATRLKRSSSSGAAAAESGAAPAAASHRAGAGAIRAAVEDRRKPLPGASPAAAGGQ